MMFGRRSERYVEDPGQQHFAFPDDGGLAAEQMAAALAQANAIIEEYLAQAFPTLISKHCICLDPVG